MPECLTFAKSWSDDNPGHFPILVLIQNLANADLTDEQSQNFEDMLLEIFSEDEIIKPGPVLLSFLLY